jgi:hypothetical protein
MTNRPLLALHAVLAAAAIAACASKPDLRTLDPAQPNKSLQCFDQLERKPQLREAGLPQKTGWAVVEYSLNGSGKAFDVRIADGRNVTDDFGSGIIRAIERAEFKKNFVSPRCRDVIEFDQATP